MNTKFLWYVIKRILISFVTVFAVITITFFAMQSVSGGPFQSEKGIPAATLAKLNALYGLDQPIGVQYLRYLKEALVFDFGPSLVKTGQSVMDIISRGFSVSGKIGSIAAVIAIFFGVVLGAVAATHQNKTADRIIMVLTTASVAMPSFVIAILFLYFFCVKVHIFPANGSTIAGYILPIITLSLYPMAYITRLTRSSTLDVLNQDFIRTAKAKGVSKSKTLFKHALRNSLTPVITYVGPMFAYIITGSLVVEQIFGIVGLGRTFVSAINGRDYPMIMGTTIFLTVIMVVMLLVSDILYKVANPRVDFD